MKRLFLTAIVIFLITKTAFGADQTQSPPQQKQYIASIAYGDGNAIPGGEMEHRTFEIRIGEKLNSQNLPDNVRVDYVYYNEGHPVNNHRDGFSTQIVFAKSVGSKLLLEFGAGPYYTMNTTTINNEELNDKHLGLLATVAAILHIENTNVDVIGQWNHVNTANNSISNGFMVGLRRNFDGSSSFEDSTANDSITRHDDLSIDTAIISAKTTHGGTHTTPAFSIDIKKQINEQWAASIGALHEHDDGVRVSRNGVVSEIWRVLPINDKWKLSAGAGPYVAINKRGSGEPRLNGIVSLRAERKIGEGHSRVKFFVEFSRIVSADNNDSDHYGIGTSVDLE